MASTAVRQSDVLLVITDAEASHLEDQAKYIFCEWIKTMHRLYRVSPAQERHNPGLGLRNAGPPKKTLTAVCRMLITAQSADLQPLPYPSTQPASGKRRLRSSGTQLFTHIASSARACTR